MSLTDLRKRLHDRCEVAGEEQETARIVKEALADAGLEPEADGVAGHGLVYVIGDRSGEGPHRLWRAELDGLPAGHRCGHDGHMTMLVGAMMRIHAEGLDTGSVTVLFQPAEETGEGMLECLHHPSLEGPFDEAYALHNIPGAPLGQAIFGPGALASEGVRLKFTGREAHAAEPDADGDVWPAMEQAIQIIRSLRPETGCATLIHVRLGEEAYGTRPGRGIVSATLRGAQEEVDGMRNTLEAHAELERVDPFPATRNDPDLTDRAVEAAKAVDLDVDHRSEPFPWSEDFGHALDRWCGVLIGIGSGEGQAPLHDDDYEFPDSLIEPGVRLWCSLVT